LALMTSTSTTPSPRRRESHMLSLLDRTKHSFIGTMAKGD
jgi:hypothetical protein